jgi:hypothetical protein
MGAGAYCEWPGPPPEDLCPSAASARTLPQSYRAKLLCTALKVHVCSCSIEYHIAEVCNG